MILNFTPYTMHNQWIFTQSPTLSTQFICICVQKGALFFFSVHFLYLAAPGRKWQPAPVFLPGESHGQRSLASYSPWGWKRLRHDLVTQQQKQGLNCGRRVGSSSLVRVRSNLGTLCQEHRVLATELPGKSIYQWLFLPCQFLLYKFMLFYFVLN